MRDDELGERRFAVVRSGRREQREADAAHVRAHQRDEVREADVIRTRQNRGGDRGAATGRGGLQIDPGLGKEPGALRVEDRRRIVGRDRLDAHGLQWSRGRSRRRSGQRNEKREENRDVGNADAEHIGACVSARLPEFPFWG